MAIALLTSQNRTLEDLIQEKTNAVSERTNGRFRVEVDEYTRKNPDNYEIYPLYSAYLFEQGHQNPYPLFAIDSKTGEDYPAEMRVADERGIPAISIKSSEELRSNLDMVLDGGFLNEHVRLVSRRPQTSKPR